jgi:hypothetical protein
VDWWTSAAAWSVWWQAKLQAPGTNARKIEDVVKSAEKAALLVLADGALGCLFSQRVCVALRFRLYAMPQ